ncbi:TPA: DNA topoisomerase [Vibrio vulnificus]
MLLVTEKYRVAKVLAQSLGFRFFEYDHFENSTGDVICFSNGHLFELTHHQENTYDWITPQNFDSLPRTLYNEFRENDIFVRGSYIPAKDLGATIIGFMQSHDTIINCCDMDREGERIFYDLFNEANTEARILRMDLSQGLTRRLVCEAFASLKDGIDFKVRHYASQARNCADFAYGLGTQVLTYYGQAGELHPFLRSASGGKQSVVSIGSVQLPTLSIINKRCKEVESYRVRQLYKPHFSVKIGRYKFEFQYDPALSGVDESLLGQSNLAQNYCKTRLVQSSLIEIIDVQARSVATAAPKPFSTAALQAAMSTMTPSESMKVLQSLYQKGLISYPRTDEESLPEEKFSNGRLSSLLESLSQNNSFSEKSSHSTRSLNELSRELEFGARPSCVSSSSSTFAHSALVPTDINSNGVELTANEQSVYNAICERFVDSLSGNGVQVECSVIAAFVEESLGVLGEERSYFRCMRMLGDATGKVDALEVGQTFEASTIRALLVERDVPQYYMLSELPEVMKNIATEFDDPSIRQLLTQSNGIGTPYTRGSVLDTLIERHYIELIYENGKQRVVITSRGQALLAVLPKMFTSVEVKALWEKQLEAIEQCRSLVKARALRDMFVKRAFDEIEQLCQMVNRKQIGAFVSNRQPADTRLKQAVIARAQLLNLDLDSSIFSSKQACQHFLMANPQPHSKASMSELEMSGLDTDANVMADPRRLALRKNTSGGMSPPSPKLLSKASKLAQLVHIQMPDKARKTTKDCIEFIKLCESKRTPSVAQVRKLKSLAKKTHFPLTGSMLKSRSEVKRLINELSKKVSK